MKMVAQGLLDKQIARIVGIEESTVKVTIKNARRRLNLPRGNQRVLLTLWALRNGVAQI
jgi:DNA-binding NarL/FixJ family response regulator